LTFVHFISHFPDVPVLAVFASVVLLQAPCGSEAVSNWVSV